jgi:hypothetical protein
MYLSRQTYGVESRKKSRMSSNQQQSVEDDCKNLITNVPIEILKLYTNFLDLKSNVMFAKVFTTAHDRNIIARCETNALFRMLFGVTQLTQNLYDMIGTVKGQQALLASVLRKLIYVSVSDMPMNAESLLASHNTLIEYKALQDIAMDEMDISSYEFNNLLENAQFEFRGFTIFNVPNEHRERLDIMKNIIHNRYFSQPVTIHTYTTFDDIFIELDCEKDNILFDIHHQHSSEGRDWMFLLDAITDWTENNGSHDLAKQFKHEKIEIKNNMLCFNTAKVYNNLDIVVKLMHKLLPYQKLFKGSNDVRLEIWNDTLEVNWVLSDVIKDIQNSGMYISMLEDITNGVQDEYNAYLLQ